jgi:tetratricopeptide (TPR) repeat protein
LGLALERMDRLQRAARAFETALGQNPSFLDAHRRLEHLYANRLNRPDRAKVHSAAIEAIGARMREQQGRPMAALAPVDVAAGVEAVARDPQSAVGVAAAVAPADIVIVSGLPRSGTSMMMQMLAAGGFPVLTDGERVADGDNPRGYFEYAKARQLQTDRSWLPEADGKAVKIVAQLLPFLPPRPHRLRIIFMQRPLEEVLASQSTMLANLDKPQARLPPEKLKAVYAGQIEAVKRLLAQSGTASTLYIDYREALEAPAKTARRIELFLGTDLDREAMAAAVDASLYHQRVD